MNNMNKRIFLLSLVSFFSLCAFSMRKPEFYPDWFFSAPKPENATYMYVVEHGEGATKREAINLALARVFQSTANHIGSIVSTADITKAINEGTSYEVLAQSMRIPINKVCEFPKQNKDDSWTVYILCQVAKNAYVSPDFEPCIHCTERSLYDKRLEEYEKYVKDSIDNAKRTAEVLQKKSNARAIAASTFIPGVGQMLKGQYGAGCGFLFGELALFGGGTACYFMADKQNDIMTKRGTSYDDYNAAKNKKKTYNIAMYCCFGAGAALHIVNMCHAYMCSDKKLAKGLSAFEPTIIPINEYSQPNYALGISWHHEF